MCVHACDCHVYCSFSSPSSTTEYTEEEAPVGITPADDGPASVSQPSGEGDLLGDLLNLDLPTAPAGGGYNAPMMGSGADLDLLSGDLSGLFLGGGPGQGMISAQPQGAIQTGGAGGLGALAELFGTSLGGGSYVAPKQVGRRREVMNSLSYCASLMHVSSLSHSALFSSPPLPFTSSSFLPSPPLPFTTLHLPFLLLRRGWRLLKARAWRFVAPGLAARVRSAWR